MPGLQSHADYLERRHFLGLDGIRCLAILAVIWHHSGTYSWTLATRGFLGVDPFFVLSGFLISTLLIREKQRTGRISLRDFWARRNLRLVPAYQFLLIGLTVTYLVVRPALRARKPSSTGCPSMRSTA